MPSLVVTTREGQTHDLHVEEGLSVMAAIKAAGFDELMALCGGCCSCATVTFMSMTGISKDFPRCNLKRMICSTSPIIGQRVHAFPARLS